MSAIYIDECHNTSETTSSGMPSIAEASYRRGLIKQGERETVKMVERTEEAGLVPSEFVKRGGEIVMRFRPVYNLPPTRVEHDLSDLQREILKVLAKTGETSVSDVLEALDDVPKRTVQDNLQTLRSLDLVELEGRGCWARWRLTDSE